MKYILLGGNGFIGKHFKSALQAGTYINCDINGGIFEEQFIYLDITKTDSFDILDLDKNEIYTLVLLAAVHFDFQTKFEKTNVEGLLNTLSYIDRNPNIAKFVFFSSVAVYSQSDFAITENSAKTPDNQYGNSKLKGEMLINEWRKNKEIKIIIVRPTVVYGEYNFGNVFNLITQIGKKKFFIIGKGDNIKSIAYAKNLVDSILFLIQNSNQETIVYNYSDFPNLSTLKLCSKIASVLRINPPGRISYSLIRPLLICFEIFSKLFGIEMLINPTRIKKFMRSTNIDSSYIRQLGYVQKYSTEQALNNTVEWLKNTPTDYLREKWYREVSKN